MHALKVSRAAYLNPLYLYPHQKQGRIVAYLGLDRDTPPFKHTPKEVTAVIKEMQRIPGGTFISGVGFYEGGKEPTSQIVFLNGGRYAKPTWREFRKLVVSMMKRLAKRFGQRIVLFEEFRPDGKYGVFEWVQYSSYATRKALAEEKSFLRKSVREGVIKVIGVR